MTAHYTLIAHKPESSDYCRNCLMESYSGDFEMEHSRDLESLAGLWKRCAQKNLSLGRSEAGYDLTLLLNGWPIEDIPDEPEEYWLEEGGDPALLELANQAWEWISRVKAEASAEAHTRKQLAEQAEAVRRRREAEAQEQRDRAQYAQLHARFGGRHA
ncbi:hypothetical protein KTD31_03275 [Burkholderia multivorans]|jgi:hypothetical protein|uniref:hypothetical protein n=1 Tax=Burkholderia multivorans TaxID=87883 RepID=UPI001C220C4F|nr:hypothetical protein [Burkholderia multivorans]MBU9200374.1 hypothetical protein [Burkholderia multivorans]